VGYNAVADNYTGLSSFV